MLRIYYGTIIIHSEELRGLAEDPVQGFTLNYSIANKHGQAWRKLYNYPNYGLSYNFKSYNNSITLGHSHSITGFYQMSFLRNHRIVDFGFKGFSGVGFFTKKYDPVTNPLNKAISSHINISAEARLYGKIRLFPIYVEYSFGLNHFSNGLIKAPNLGINVLNNSFCLGYEFEDQPKDIEVFEMIKMQNLKHELWAFVSVGLKGVEDSRSKSTFSSLSINYSKPLTVINKVGFGVDFLNDPTLTSVAFKKYHYLGDSHFDFRYGFNLHNEFSFGNTGFFMAYGMYIRKSDYYSSRGYYKVGVKYSYKNVLAVVLIRALPLFRADVVEFGVGYKISKYRN